MPLEARALQRKRLGEAEVELPHAWQELGPRCHERDDDLRVGQRCRSRRTYRLTRMAWRRAVRRIPGSGSQLPVRADRASGVAIARAADLVARARGETQRAARQILPCATDREPPRERICARQLERRPVGNVVLSVV